MNTQQQGPDVNPAQPKVTCCHRFTCGHVATFRLFRAHTTIDWEPKLLTEPSGDLFTEFYQWYADVLGIVIESGHPKMKVVKSVLLSKKNFITGWHVEFDDGLRVEVEIPHELLYSFTATKNGRDVSTKLDLKFWCHFVWAFVLRMPTR